MKKVILEIFKEQRKILKVLKYYLGQEPHGTSQYGCVKENSEVFYQKYYIIVSLFYPNLTSLKSYYTKIYSPLQRLTLWVRFTICEKDS